MLGGAFESKQSFAAALKAWASEWKNPSSRSQYRKTDKVLYVGKEFRD